jgi:hypothetical protein
MNRHRVAAFAAVMALVVSMLAPAAAQVDPYTGVWVRRAGADKSTQILTIKVADNQETYTSDSTAANGRRQVTNYSAKYDGTEYPSETVITDPPNEGGRSTTRKDSVILKKIDERKRERHWKQNGRIVRILRRVVSADGKVLTSEVVDIDERGQEKLTSTLVFDKK